MSYSEELNEFKCCTVKGCHLCNKTVCEIGKWKRLETTATQPRSGRPQVPEWGLLRSMVHKSRQRSADPAAKEFQTSAGINVSTKLCYVFECNVIIDHVGVRVSRYFCPSRAHLWYVSCFLWL